MVSVLAGQQTLSSKPDGREPYTVVIPPPNVTGVLHMGHMLNNTIPSVVFECLFYFFGKCVRYILSCGIRLYPHLTQLLLSLIHILYGSTVDAG